LIFQSKLNNFQYDYEDVKNEGFISGTVEELEKELTTVFVPRLVVKIKYEGHKVCCNCEQPKMLSEFYKAKESKDGRRHNCKLCLKKESNKTYYKKLGKKILQRI